MAKSLPPRDSKGRFKSTGSSSSSSSKSKSLPPRDPRTGRFVSKYRANPVGGDIVGMLTGGAVEAGQILAGKAAARSVPDLLGMPKSGNTGLAIQAAVAVGLGYMADMFLSPNAARAILAGGLTAPMETMIVAYQVPWLSDALSPAQAGSDLGAYNARRRMGRGVSSYVPRSSSGGSGGGGGQMGRYARSPGATMGAYSYK